MHSTQTPGFVDGRVTPTDMMKNSSLVALLQNPKLNATTTHIVEIWSATLVQTTVCFMGTILNILNFIVFRQRQFTATPYLYMSALAIADAGTLLVYLPTGITKCDRRIPICFLPFTKDFRTFISYYHTYVGFGLGNIFEAMSSWITVLICIERYVIMRWPHLGKLHFSRRAARCQIICTICFVILFHLPMFFALEIERGETVTGNNTSKRYLKMGMTWFGHSMYYYVITWVRFMCIQCVPLALLCVVNLRLLILIWSNYRKQRMHSVHLDNGDDVTKREEFLSSIIEHQSEIVIKLSPDYADRERPKGYREERMASLQVPKLCPVGSNHQRKNSSGIQNAAFYGSRLDRTQQANLKLTILLVVVIFSFILGQIPQAFAYVHIIKLVVPRDCVDCIVYVNLYRHFSQLLCLITSTTNFFLYVALNRHYRSSLKSLVFHSQ
ncbi:hypothetical protein CRM22_003778 [Opisthorchis felineus]|uniref:G-protein coupled receptors family 1 profile domain-containing protein n=1 Tax=Opisthorchis felineus TaxID=147828 RepID=A0A4V3SFR4_OPIFE|nr:hypothetical protein CRM22_003778 [Opisthorchis felineus]